MAYINEFETWSKFNLENRNKYYQSTYWPNFHLPTQEKRNGITEQQFFDGIKQKLIREFNHLTRDLLKTKGGLDGLQDPISSELLWALYNQVDFMIGNGYTKDVLSSGNASMGNNSISIGNNITPWAFMWSSDFIKFLKKYHLADPSNLKQPRWSWKYGWIDLGGYDADTVATKKYADEIVYEEKLAREQQDKILSDKIDLKLNITDALNTSFQVVDNEDNPVGNPVVNGLTREIEFRGLLVPDFDTETKKLIIDIPREVPTTGATVQNEPIENDTKDAISAGYSFDERDRINKLVLKIENDIKERSPITLDEFRNSKFWQEIPRNYDFGAQADDLVIFVNFTLNPDVSISDNYIKFNMKSGANGFNTGQGWTSFTGEGSYVPNWYSLYLSGSNPRTLALYYNKTSVTDDVNQYYGRIGSGDVWEYNNTDSEKIIIAFKYIPNPSNDSFKLNENINSLVQLEETKKIIHTEETIYNNLKNMIEFSDTRFALLEISPKANNKNVYWDEIQELNLSKYDELLKLWQNKWKELK